MLDSVSFSGLLHHTIWSWRPTQPQHCIPEQKPQMARIQHIEEFKSFIIQYVLGVGVEYSPALQHAMPVLQNSPRCWPLRLMPALIVRLQQKFYYLNLWTRIQNIPRRCQPRCRVQTTSKANQWEEQLYSLTTAISATYRRITGISASITSRLPMQFVNPMTAFGHIITIVHLGKVIRLQKTSRIECRGTTNSPKPSPT